MILGNFLLCKHHSSYLCLDEGRSSTPLMRELQEKEYAALIDRLGRVLQAGHVEYDSGDPLFFAAIVLLLVH